jgi:hypothetical protein
MQLSSYNEHRIECRNRIPQAFSNLRPVILSLFIYFLSLSVSTASASEGSEGTGRNGDLGFPTISWGFKAGFSLSQHSGVMERGADYGVSSHWRKGFTGGLFLYVPMTPRFGLQQEVLYVQKGSQQDITVDILDIPTVLCVKYDMDYIEIPVLLRYTWFRRNNRVFYSFAGTSISFKVHDRYILKGEVDDGVEQVPLYADSDISEVEMFDYSFVFGLGLDFKLWSTELLVEYRFTIGWNELDMPTYAYVPFEGEDLLIENEPVPLKNQAHLFLLGIKF